MADELNPTGTPPQAPPTNPPADPPADPPKDPPAEPPAAPPEPNPDEGEPGVREKSEIKVEIPAGDEYDPYDAEKAKSFVAGAVQKALTPFQEKQEEARIKSETDNILRDHPEYEPYKGRIEKWVNHPNRKGLIKQGLPVEAVVAEALMPFMQKIGADKARKAQEEADKTKNPGQQNRPASGGTPNFAAMTNEQIQNIAEQVKSGRYQG